MWRAVGGKMGIGWHDGRVPAPVRELLEYTLPRCPKIAGIMFELLNYYATKMTVDAIAGELTRAGQIWRRRGRASGAMQE
jgi:hypothetical protein